MKKRRFLSFLFVCVLSLSLSVPAFASEGFTDVSSSAYYSEAINWALANGITNGRGDGTFGVGSNVTRAEAVTFLWRSAGSPTPKAKNCPFVDVESDIKNNYWYRDAVIWANENGITTGTSATTFSPNDPVTRGQLIAFLYRTKGGETQSGANWYTAAEQWATNNGLLNGTAETYETNKDCPREDVVYYLWREMKSAQTQPVNTSNVGKNAHEVPGSVDPEDGHVYTYTHNPAYDDGRGGSYDAWIDQLYAECEGLYSKAELRSLYLDVAGGNAGTGGDTAGSWGQG